MLKESKKSNKEGSCEEEEHEKYASTGNENGLKEWTVEEEAESDRSENHTTETELTCACAESE